MLDPAFGHCRNSDWTPARTKPGKITVVAVNKCPKPSGQAFRPTHPNRQCPNVGDVNAKGCSLSCPCSSIPILDVVVVPFSEF